MGLANSMYFQSPLVSDWLGLNVGVAEAHGHILGINVDGE